MHTSDPIILSVDGCLSQTFTLCTEHFPEAEQKFHVKRKKLAVCSWTSHPPGKGIIYYIITVHKHRTAALATTVAFLFSNLAKNVCLMPVAATVDSTTWGHVKACTHGWHFSVQLSWLAVTMEIQTHIRTYAQVPECSHNLDAGRKIGDWGISQK